MEIKRKSEYHYLYQTKQALEKTQFQETKKDTDTT